MRRSTTAEHLALSLIRTDSHVLHIVVRVVRVPCVPCRHNSDAPFLPHAVRDQSGPPLL